MSHENQKLLLLGLTWTSLSPHYFVPASSVAPPLKAADRELSILQDYPWEAPLPLEVPSTAPQISWHGHAERQSMTYGRMTPSRSSWAPLLPADPDTAHNEAGREERGAEMKTEPKWEESEKRGCPPFAFLPIILLLHSAHKHGMHAPEVQCSHNLGF